MSQKSCCQPLGGSHIHYGELSRMDSAGSEFYSRAPGGDTGPAASPLSPGRRPGPAQPVLPFPGPSRRPRSPFPGRCRSPGGAFGTCPGPAAATRPLWPERARCALPPGRAGSVCAVRAAGERRSRSQRTMAAAAALPGTS